MVFWFVSRRCCHRTNVRSYICIHMRHTLMNSNTFTCNVECWMDIYTAQTTLAIPQKELWTDCARVPCDEGNNTSEKTRATVDTVDCEFVWGCTSATRARTKKNEPFVVEFHPTTSFLLLITSFPEYRLHSSMAVLRLGCEKLQMFGNT